MTKFRLSIAVAAFTLFLCSFRIQNDTFTALLNRAGMTFEPPTGWLETPVISNNQMHYDYAIKSPDKKFEVRYAVRPMDTLLQQYQRMLKKPGSVQIHPNSKQFFTGAFAATVMNIASREKAPQMKAFDSLAVKREFNADKGMVAMTFANKAFAQDYHFCSVVAIQKDGVAYAYCFIMFDNMDDFKALAPVVYYVLKFK